MGKNYVWSVATSKGTRFSSLSFQVSTSTKADWTRSTTWRVFILCTLTGVALRLCFTSPPYCPTRKTILRRYTTLRSSCIRFIDNVITPKIIIITRTFLFIYLFFSFEISCKENGTSATISSASCFSNPTRPTSHRPASNPIFSTRSFSSRCRRNRAGNPPDTK